MFGQDQKWYEAKKIAKMTNQENNWIEVISYYRELGGTFIQLFCIVDEDRKRVVELTEDENVLTLNREGEWEVYPYDTIFQSEKNFFFNESPQVREVPLPEGIKTINGDTKIELYE